MDAALTHYFKVEVVAGTFVSKNDVSQPCHQFFLRWIPFAPLPIPSIWGMELLLRRSRSGNLRLLRAWEGLEGLVDSLVLQSDWNFSSARLVSLIQFYVRRWRAWSWRLWPCALRAKYNDCSMRSALEVFWCLMDYPFCRFGLSSWRLFGISGWDCSSACFSALVLFPSSSIPNINYIIYPISKH